MSFHLGGVDTLDHILEVFSCRRKTNRWTVNCFYYILDAIGYNSFVCYKIKNPNEFITDSKRKRCGFLISIAHSLIRTCINERFQMFKNSNFLIYINRF